MIYLFNNKENLMKIIPRKDIKEAIQTIELNKSLSLYVGFKKINFDIINECEYVGHFYDDKFYMYRIIKNDIANTNTIKGTHIVFDELKSNGYIRDKRPTQISAAVALGTILDGTRWQVGKVESNNIASSNWYDISRLDALSDFIDKWNVELDYRINFDGQKITGRYIDIYNRLGSNTGKRLVYGSNALDITAESSKANIYTALIGRGKGEETTGGYGRRIQFTDVEWSKAKGNPVNKPKGQEYVEIPERTAQFGFSNGQPRVKVVVFDDCTDPQELLKLTYAELENISRPQVAFKTVVYKSMNFYIGDSVNIIRRDLNLFYESRVFKIERNLLNNDLTTIELGDYIPTNAEKNTKDIRGKIDAFNSAIDGFKDVGSKVNGLLEDLKNGLELQYFNDSAYNYELSEGNKWGLPAGYYSFDKALDNNPTKVIYFGAGKIMIANRKRSDGSWDWSTFGTGDGFVADSITSGKIVGSLIESNSISTDHIQAGAITLDILRPGKNQRIIFEGDDPGNNDCKSIDANYEAIRLKNSASSYISIWDDQIAFYTRGKATRSKGSELFADAFNQTSDVRLKENIRYLNRDTRIKPNESVKITDLTSLDIYDFIKNANLATYNYLFDENSRISFIAQDLLKFDKISSYLIKVDEDSKDKRKFIDASNLQNITVAAVQELIKKVENLESEITNLKGGK